VEEVLTSSKLLLSIMLLFVLISYPSVGASSEMWSQIYEIDRHQQVYSVIETSDGGYALAGGYSLIDDFWLVKIDEWGNIQWNMTYGGEKNDYATSLVETSDGGYALAGRTESFGQGEEDFWLVKTDADGTMQWNRTYGGPNSEKLYSMVQTSDGGYALAGDELFVKTDAYGNMEWNRTIIGGGVRAMVQTSDGGYALAGRLWLMKTDSMGLMEWKQTYEETGRGDNLSHGLIVTPDGGYAKIGAGLLIKTDEYGSMEWNQTYEDSLAFSLIATSDGGYAFVLDNRLIKTDAQGNVVWSESYEPRYEWSSLQLSSVIETSDGGYAIAGNIFEFFTGKSVILVAKTNEYGVIPEFPSWTPLIITLVAVVAITFVYRQKLQSWGNK
jgi:hypothetical protein